MMYSSKTLGEIAHIKKHLSREESDDYFKRLRKEIPWTFQKWGRKNLPRKIYRYDPEDTRIDSLDEIALLTEEVFKCSVQGMWCNLYRDGNDHTKPHQDEYGAHVITYSFGASRECVTTTKSGAKKTSYRLRHGDLFYFTPEFDAGHKHSVPKDSSEEERISIVLFVTEPGSKIQGTNVQNLEDLFDIVRSGGTVVLSEEQMKALLVKFK